MHAVAVFSLFAMCILNLRLLGKQSASKLELCLNNRMTIALAAHGFCEHW